MATLTQGETLSFRESITGASSVSAKYAGQIAGTVSLTQNGNQWSGTLDTESVPQGNYTVQIWAIFLDGTKKITRQFHLRINSAIHSGNNISKNREAIEKIDEMLSGRASDGVQRYKINNRELHRYTMKELIMLRSHFVKAAQREESKLAGRTNNLGPRIYIRF